MSTSSDFALIGAAGFVAPRHMRAIAATGNRLVAALDPSDNVGVLDQHFPDAHFFTEFERFEQYVEDLRQRGTGVGYVSVCSPNYLHSAHVRFGLRHGAHVICEKPLVLDPSELDVLARAEVETGRRVYTVLQLRLHPVIRALRERYAAAGEKRDVDLAYITSRGRWYHESWKGRPAKSGGIAANIGIHFFDMLQWVFGPCENYELHRVDTRCAAGYLELARARVRWFLSIDETTLPPEVRARGQRTYRSIRIDGEELEFSEGFTDLHTATYQGILAGEGFGLEDARSAVQLVYDLGQAQAAKRDSMHPLALKPILSAT